MSSADRKARKRAGIKFTKPAKERTPVEERSWLRELVWDPETRVQRHHSIARQNKERAKWGLSPLD